MWVRYEELSENPQRVLSGILEFIGLNDSSGIDLHRTWSVHERSDKIRNMNDESIRRLSPADVATIEAVAGEALIRFGYELLSKRSPSPVN
jgi:hypothetical protein